MFKISEYGKEPDTIVPCRKLRWTCRQHSNDMDRQVETRGKSTIFVARQMYPVARHDFHVALEVTIYRVSQKKSIHA